MIDSIISVALREFEAWLLASDWRGKEHDCVNLFVHGFLFKHVREDASIKDFTQVGIEVAVPQPVGIGVKPSARKDLVIWDAPRTVTWDAEWNAIRHPIVIIEWKARRKKQFPLLDPRDLEWLRRYSLHYRDFTGYAVTVDFSSQSCCIATARIHGGIVYEDFHK